MMKLETETEVIDFGRKVDTLMKQKLFQEVIIEGYINATALAVGTDFDIEDIDKLKGITLLKRYLEEAVNEAEKLVIRKGK